MTSFDETVNSLRHRFEQDNQPLPRVTLGAINSDGSFHYAKAFGEEFDSPAGTNAVYWLASATKIITTIAVIQCVERGQLHLDDDIAQVLPEWKDPQILTGFNDKDEPIFKLATKAITFRQVILLPVSLMLMHGMAYVFMEPLLTRYLELYGKPPIINKSINEKFPHQFLIFEPGERFMYSPAIDWAGVAVERVTSMKLGEYMQRNIFDVVSVNDITFHLDLREDLRARKAKNWERVGDSLKEQTRPIYADPAETDFGGGGLFASVNDLLKIYQGLLTGKLLRPETVKEMFQPQLKSISGLDNPAEHSSAYRNSIWNTIPDDVPINFGIGGVINTAPVLERRGWIDLINGVAGVYLSQLVPSGDLKAMELLTEFEKFVYSSLEKS
ncbi:hypothetical protein ACEPPN_000866 [Leptodophora sp. 'Broadleaf-Isolate-01']